MLYKFMLTILLNIMCNLYICNKCIHAIYYIKYHKCTIQFRLNHKYLYKNKLKM